MNVGTRIVAWPEFSELIIRDFVRANPKRLRQRHRYEHLIGPAALFGARRTHPERPGFDAA